MEEEQIQSIIKQAEALIDKRTLSVSGNQINMLEAQYLLQVTIVKQNQEIIELLSQIAMRP